MSDAGDEANEVGETYTEVEHENLSERLSGACAGICVGLLLFFGSFPLLFWNESRAVDRYDALNEAESEVTSVSGLNIDPANDGKLLHFSVNVTNGGNSVVDPTFGIESDGVVLRRYAEMYQWTERAQSTSKKDLGGGKTTTTNYSYKKEWKNNRVQSASFKKAGYYNPSMEFEAVTVFADPIMIGAYKMPEELSNRLTWEKAFTVNVSDISNEAIRGRAKQLSNGFYFGNSTNSTVPQVGDQRISFTETPPSIFTIVGVQNGDTLSAFVSDSGDGGDVLLIKEGKHTATAMFDEAEAGNAFLTWILRFVGYILMTLGLYLVFRPIEVFADIIPCVGSIIGCGIIFMAALISAILSIITISVAWLVAHPAIGAIVLGVSLAVVGCCAFGAKKLSEHRSDGKDEDDINGSSSPSSFSDVEKPVASSTVPTVYAIPAPEPVGNEPTVSVTPGAYVPGG